jgi:hypothetical protein
MCPNESNVSHWCDRALDEQVRHEQTLRDDAQRKRQNAVVPNVSKYLFY